MLSTAPTPPDDFEAWEIEAANAVVRAFIAARGTFATHDFEELVQECLVHWWQQRKRYAEGRGANRRTFMNRVLTNRLRDLRREEQAEKRRGDREALSLDERLDAGEARAWSLADLLVDEDVHSRPEEAAKREAIREAIARVRDRLGPRRQALLDGLLAEQSMSEISRILGTPRASLYDELERIKTEFRAEGLEEFLDLG